MTEYKNTYKVQASTCNQSELIDVDSDFEAEELEE
jgi:hypothetical protein